MSRTGSSLELPPGAMLRAWLWDLFQVVVGGNKQKKAMLRARMPRAGRILEIGCATGNIADVFSELDYVGVDIDAGCIALAARKFPQSNFRFHCADLLEHELPEAQGFDTVLVSQCAHHLSDADMRRMLHRSATLLRSGGELVIFDLVRPGPGESFNKKFYFKLDRGEHVRSERELLAFFDPNDAFGQPEAEVLTTHKLGIEVMDLILIRARRQAVSGEA